MNKTADEWKNLLEEAVEVVDSNYDPEQWERKEEVDSKRYKYVKDIYEAFTKAVEKEDIVYEWEEDEFEEKWYEWNEETEKLLQEVKRYIAAYESSYCL